MEDCISCDVDCCTDCGDGTCDASENCSLCPADCGCDDGNPCTDDVCSFTTGCSFVPNTDACDDGNPCTLGDACSSGTCTGTLRECAPDGNPCTQDLCDSATGSCYPPVPAGTSCDDGNMCTSTSTCDGAGTCSGTVDVTCVEDMDPCTDTVRCDPATGACIWPPKADGEACDPPGDGDVCTENDTCNGGTCMGDPVTCASDGDPCTRDECDTGFGGCYPPAPAGTACDDGLLCTTGDNCDGSGGCTVASAVICAPDGNSCTSDACNPATGLCDYPPLPDGAACDDGDACTDPDTCSTVAGISVCVGGAAVDCTDADMCTVDTCDPASGCVNTLECPCEDDGGSSWSAGFELSLPYQVRSPVFGGNVGAALELSGMTSGSPADCASGCVSTGDGLISGSATVGICKGFLDEWSVAASLETNTARRHCQPCDRSTCKSSCAETAYCEDGATTVGAEFGISKFWGWEAGWDGIWGLDIGVELSCGVTVSTGVEFMGTEREVVDNSGGCVACMECRETDVSATIPIDATAGCGVTASVWGEELQLGCEECARLGLMLTGQVRKPCAGESCMAASARAGFGYQTPALNVGVPWMGGIELSCAGEKWMTCRASSGASCGSTGCDDPEGDLLQCTAEATGLLRAALEAAGVEL